MLCVRKPDNVIRGIERGRRKRKGDEILEFRIANIREGFSVEKLKGQPSRFVMIKVSAEALVSSPSYMYVEGERIEGRGLDE